MYVTVTQIGEGEPTVYVMGENLKREAEGHFLLPGRLIHALKPDDLPIGIGFALDGTLPSGYGMYREDRVVFSRRDESNTFWVEVTSTYRSEEWDGLFPLDATLLSRQQFLQEKEAFSDVRYHSTDGVFTICYAFASPVPDTYDLEQAVEAICDTVFEVEARGNMRLWHGDTWHGQYE
jgi:hypothetical protein